MNVLDFGKTKDGVQTHLYTIKNEDLECRVTDFGSILVNLFVPDKHGKPVDVVLGFDTVSGYEQDTASLGCNVGRCANRIGGASFTLDGRTYTLDKNDGENCLHSGFHQYSKRIWTVTQHTGTSVAFSLDSPDMDQGFPGAVTMTVTYELKENQLIISYAGTPDKDTIINMTNHSYFNLNGHASGTALGHRVSVDADAYLEMDDTSVPTGRRIPVAGTPMDFNEEKTLGLDIEADYPALKQACGYDHCYIIRDAGLRHAAWVTGPQTGIRMEVLTTLPGMHLYTANYLAPATACKDGAHYQKRHAVCLETEEFPDAPNHPDFPDTTLLPDTPYSSTTIYRFDIAPQ